MVVFEIENMDTHESGYVEAETEQEMFRILGEKGFTNMGNAFLAGHNGKGEEVSAMRATFPNVKHILPLKQIN